MRIWPYLALALGTVLFLLVVGRWAAVIGATLAGVGPAVLLARARGSIRPLSLVVFFSPGAGALLLEALLNDVSTTSTLLISVMVGLYIGFLLWVLAVRACLDNQLRHMRAQEPGE